MDNKVLSFIKQKNMLKRGDTVIVALSGGADSMTLFHFLLANKHSLGIRLCAAHVNHNLRQESTHEANIVKQLCEDNNTPLFLKELTPNGNKSEDWAREERYAFFDEIASEHNAKIATAHTASDNAETLIFRLCRGTALNGACGIPAVRQCYIRPLLSIFREDTEKYCSEHNIAYFIDKTNLTDEYARGRVRNNIMPQLNLVHENAEKSIVRFINCVAETQDYINTQAQSLIKGKESLDAKTISQAHPAIQKAALSLWLSSYCEINELIVNNACGLICKKSGKTNLPNNLSLYNAQGKLYVAPQKSSNINTDIFPIKQGEILYSNGKKLLCDIMEYEEFINYWKVEKKDLIFCADYGKISVNATFRTKNSGDKFTQQGRKVTKTLKKLFSEDGIMQHQRNEIPVLAHDSNVLWLWGYGFCQGLEPTNTTKQVLIIRIIEEEIIMHEDVLKVLLSEKEISDKTKELGALISKDYESKNLILVTVLKGAVVFLADLMRAIDIHAEIDFMVVSSYGAGVKSSGVVKIIKDLDVPLEGKDILIVEDILDSGLTLSYIKELLASRNPSSIKIVTLLDKPARRKVDLAADYVGFIVPDEFVIGYGLDFDEKYRNLPYIGVLKPEVYTN